MKIFVIYNNSIYLEQKNILLFNTHADCQTIFFTKLRKIIQKNELSNKMDCVGFVFLVKDIGSSNLLGQKLILFIRYDYY